ncbi:hypothetical protein CUN60_04455 [Aquella oligotrophica]|uniref:Smr domain-containing protein n=2 Tax=Aquella oligotrophica TaxID=2067065 RepID=A0A2I7N537_9NEIS|nr:hypothetical protein CUN60_04455 [Aquella oligotrophica]
MWHDKLKKLKKQSTLISKNRIEKQESKNETLDDISFKDYCLKNNIKAISNDTVELQLTQIKLERKLIQPYESRQQEGFDFFDEYKSDATFFRYGQKNLPKELRNEKFRISAVLDLHNYSKLHALDLLERFINANDKASCLKIIHGQGENSINNQPVLMNIVRRYLQNLPQIIGYSYGSPKQGGNGVTIIKLGR